MEGSRIFEEWAENLPLERKVRIAEELLLIAKSNHLTLDEQKKVEEAEKFLLQRDDQPAEEGDLVLRSPDFFVIHKNQIL